MDVVIQSNYSTYAKQIRHPILKPRGKGHKMTATNPDTVKLIELDSTIERGYGNLPLFTVRPDIEGPLPALILVHEIFGLNNHIRDVARRFARKGIVVFAPDLFAGHSAAPDNRDDLNAMRNLWSTISDDQLISDLQAVLQSARRRICAKQCNWHVGILHGRRNSIPVRKPYSATCVVHRLLRKNLLSGNNRVQTTAPDRLHWWIELSLSGSLCRG